MLCIDASHCPAFDICTFFCPRSYCKNLDFAQQQLQPSNPDVYINYDCVLPIGKIFIILAAEARVSEFRNVEALHAVCFCGCVLPLGRTLAGEHSNRHMNPHAGSMRIEHRYDRLEK